MTSGPEKKKTWLVILLSLIPGLSLVYLGRFKKTLMIFIVDIGIVSGFVLSDSYLFKLILINIYFFTFLAPFLESYQLVRYGRNTIDSESRWYVTILLLTTGFNALPLLWNSDRFSRKAKIAWTIAVPLLFLLFLSVLVKYWDRAESLLRSLLGKTA